MMNLANLQSWLFEEGIRDELNVITQYSVITELDNVKADSETISINNGDWNRLILAGSILARSELREHLEAALRIATGAIILSKSQSIKDAGVVLLRKLANFRAVELASQRNLVAPKLDERLGIALRIETQRQQMEHSVLVESNGEWLPVNEFQQKFWNHANNYDWLSASAPTASGKTFIVIQWLFDQMHATDIRVAVYLAPTRALVSEIESYLHDIFGKDSNVEISSLPLRDKFDAARVGKSKLILVFTQERLHLLANILKDAINIDLLIVDEAHKIGDNQRGVILQDAIERMVRANPRLKLVFVSPATQNPEELLMDAPRNAQTAYVNADIPTVLQNLILAEQVPLKPKLWKLLLHQQGNPLLLGVLHLHSSPNGVRKRLAFVAAAAGERGGTLVYANGASESEEIAMLISQLIPQLESPDEELEELADLIRKGVHPNYSLEHLVKHGVAFHYGNMPSLIRLEVERLFRCGKIRFLVCTSTLIEGVNLSCRTIVLRGPRKGIGHPMEPHDFWNLAGRAGRWGDEFQGNIICIDPHDYKAWPSGIPIRSRYPIKRESDAVLEKGEDMANYLDQRVTTPLSELANVDQFEQVGAYLLATFMRLGSIIQSDFAKRHTPQIIGKLEQKLAVLAEKIDIEMDIIERHPGVSAVSLQNLLNAFRTYEGDVENLLPAVVESQDSYDRFITIMNRINKHLYPAFMPEKLIPLHALIVVQWLKGLSLSLIIRKNIEYHKKSNRSYQLAALIRNTMELVEQTARFRAPKFFSAYVDILNLHLRQIDRDDLIDNGIDIGTQLEFGVSSQTLLSLMGLGLSRMGAVALYEKIARDDLTKDACIAWITDYNRQLEGMDIPIIILREIREKLLD